MMMASMILEPLLETLKGVFANKLTEDDREPIATFELPFVEPGSFMWALYPPKLHLWHQLIMVRCLLVACLLSVLVKLVTRGYGCPGDYHTLVFIVA
jgi:hypothetical protein